MADDLTELKHCVLPELPEPEHIAIQNLLSTKSEQRYEQVYSKFVHWCRAKNIFNYSEYCMLSYFQDFSNTKTILPHYSMLKSCLIIRDKIDISKYKSLTEFLRKQTKSHKLKKSRVFDDEQICTFINEAPDSSYLLMKVVLIMGISGACRREALSKMSIDDIEFETNVIFVSVPGTRTNICRRFTVTEPSWIALLVKYNELRPKTNKRFFLKYREGKCINSPVGINTLGKIPTRIAEYLKLEKPDEYTGHSFIRSSANLLSNHEGYLVPMRRLGGSISSIEPDGCVEDPLQDNAILPQKFEYSEPGPSSATEEDTMNFPLSDTSSDVIDFAAPTDNLPIISVKNCSNCPINIYKCENCCRCRNNSL